MRIPLHHDLTETCMQFIRETLHMSDEQTLSVYEMGLFKTKWSTYTLRAKCRIGAPGTTESPWFNFKMVIGREKFHESAGN